ncbi:FAD-dependent oxidoreductase [Paracraurococcus lichenis]|uniref:GMC family oxidoreductase n=1 Tax=Paracraurococcus lichenis TaxID=3064888 RepID=A0ABT9DWX9_9PROT|nr:GMC family oxidoreductase [Paracraurococcus sp. LOR1-02]MDO9708403.1 GMC family oxidoreductase [Paracraurococcus sp. LOR1-02]
MTTAATEDCDVAIVGSGVAGAHLAYALARKGSRVLVLEAGQRRTRAELTRTFYDNPSKGPQSAYPPDPFAPFPDDDHYDEFYVQGGAMKFIGAYLRLVGGTSWHWTGFADRLRPVDFRMRSTYGVAEDWPVTYEDLEPYYEVAEREWGVAGDLHFTWGAPRRSCFPLPPIPATTLDRALAPALASLGLSAGLFSHARNSKPFDGRPACCGNNSCVPICPIGAKYDASVHVAKAEAAGARLIERARVDFVELGPDRRVARLLARRPDGSVLAVTARHYVLCCHAIETPRLLLASKQPLAPHGVANGSDNVGRWLLTQANQDTQGLTPKPVLPYRGPQQTSGIQELRDGPFRRSEAAVGTSFMNSGWSGNSDATEEAKALIGRGLKGAALVRALNDRVSRHLRLNSSAETLPRRENRVELDPVLRDAAGIPRPRVTFALDDYTRHGLAKALDINRRIFRAMGATEVTAKPPYLSNAIIAGTTRMGRDPRHSVVAPDLRTHEHANLSILGASTHVTAPVNAPSLTIAALAYRLADRLTAPGGMS